MTYALKGRTYVSGQIFLTGSPYAPCLTYPNMAMYHMWGGAYLQRSSTLPSQGAGPHQRPHTHVHTRTPYLRSYGFISTKYEIVIHAERSVYRESLSHTPITRGLGPSVPKFLGPCTCAHIVLRSSKQILHDDQTIYIGR